jgi:hypothetical protein
MKTAGSSVIEIVAPASVALKVTPSARQQGIKHLLARASLLFFALLFLLPYSVSAQTDQGAVTGVIQDSSGAVVSGANVTLTSSDNGLIFHRQTDATGVYVFSPVKIGIYQVSATAAGFQTTTRQNVRLDLQQRLEVDFHLEAGSVSQVVQVTDAPPLLQTEESSTGQVISAKTIDATPLNGRNWVFIAQLTAGVDGANGARGQGRGDFNANGQRAEQNNFILDGVDNNTNVVDFLNGASFVVRPPPDALAEFKVQTGAYSAEFGHSAGAVVNASIKAGTNQIHGDVWEYFRNDVLDARDYFAQSVPKYRQNQFGATLGLPLIKDKVFLFGDVEANRIVFGEQGTYTVPTALMRAGDFTELLQPGLTGQAQPVTLYQPGSGGVTPLTCGGRQNVLCPSQISPVAQKILNLYPSPNANGNLTYNNYNVLRNVTDNTFQWDLRADWNISQKDQTFARFSYLNEPGSHPAPLGPILDGGSYGDTGSIKNLGENFALSETHVFTSSLTNEFRFGYNYGHFTNAQFNANTDTAAALGLGGIPFAPLNGGLPFVAITGIQNFGAPEFYAANEYENVFQILDNVTKVAGKHTLKGGVSLQHIRFYTLAPINSRGSYAFDGKFTGQPGTSFTGSGVADFLANQTDTAGISNFQGVDQERWARSGYFQDDWRASQSLTLNLGIRYEYQQPIFERHQRQARFDVTGPLGPGTGAGDFLLPTASQNIALPQSFLTLLEQNNVALQYTNNNSLVDAQHLNFAPRVGFANKVTNNLVVRGGFGLFFGGLESQGGAPNLGFNYPFQFSSNFNSGNCNPDNCPTNGITLESGFAKQIAAGLVNAVQSPSLVGSQARIKTPYSEQFNLSTEYAFTNNLVVTASYVGSVSRHLAVSFDRNGPEALIAPSVNSQTVRAFPGLNGVTYTLYEGSSNYNSLQTKIEQRSAKGLTFLATYTYSHSLDDAPTPLGSNADGGYRSPNLTGIGVDYSNSPWDTRHRVTLNGTYDLPVGRGRQYLDNNSLLNYAVGGWSSSLVFRAQTGQPFTVYGDNSAVNGASTRAILIGNPFAAGGSPDPSNPGVTCPTKVRTVAHWYNPCAFANPPNGNIITGTQQVTGSAALALLGGVRNQAYGPGYERVDMSIFKSFPVFREQNLQFRADIFNVLNTPAYGTPNGSIGSNGGLISSTRSLQTYSPDARFLQFALKYLF